MWCNATCLLICSHIFPEEISHFNWKPQIWEFYVRKKHFPMQISQLIQVGHPTSPCCPTESYLVLLYGSKTFFAWQILSKLHLQYVTTLLVYCYVVASYMDVIFRTSSKPRPVANFIGQLNHAVTCQYVFLQFSSEFRVMLTMKRCANNAILGLGCR